MKTIFDNVASIRKYVGMRVWKGDLINSSLKKTNWIVIKKFLFNILLNHLWNF